MALINCPECGKEISDMAKNCPNCGYPINEYVLDLDKETEKKIDETYTNEIACPYCGELNHPDAEYCVGCNLRLKSYININNQTVSNESKELNVKKSYKFNIIRWLIVIPVIYIIFIIIGMQGETEPVAETYEQSEEESFIESSVSEEISTYHEEESSIVEPQESKEEFIASCKEVSYKKLLRNPEDYIGERVVLTAEVQQILLGGWFDDNHYYRIQTDNDGYGYYYGDEYFMYDFRVEDDMKILEGDVIKLYAEFVGMEEVKRAITSVKEEVPAVKAYYVDLISE